MALFSPDLAATFLPGASAVPLLVFADFCRCFVQEVFAGVADSGVDFLNSPFGFVPVFAELFLSAHFALGFAQSDFMLFEAAQRFNEAAIAQGGEANNPHVYANGAGGCWNGLFDFALSLDTGEPLATGLTDGDVFGCTQNVSAVAITNPAQLWKLDAAVVLVNIEALRKPEAVAGTTFFETWVACAFFKEVFECSLGIFERLLQGLRGRFFEPRELFLPFWKAICHIDITDELAACLKVGFLNIQSLVVDKPTCPGEAAHIALLLAVWHQLEFECLQAFHFFLFKKSSIARRISSATESPVCFANSCSFAIEGSVR